jgi:flagellar biogenesis protein FliO
MLCTLRSTALVLLALAPCGLAFAQSDAAAQSSPGRYQLPDWQIGGVPAADQRADKSEAPPRSVAAAAQQVDPAIQLVSHTVEDPPVPNATTNQDVRRLAPRGKSDAERRNGLKSPSQFISGLRLKFDSMYATGTALAIVLGLFFVCIWLLRRGGKKKAALLPAEVVSVLGRIALAPKQMAELLRVGNKLVLVALTPDGAKPLTEVTDPEEVDRLTGLCQRHDPHSATAAFEQVFRELSRDPAPTGFLGQESPLAGTLPDLPLYFSPRGGTGRA